MVTLLSSFLLHNGDTPQQFTQVMKCRFSPSFAGIIPLFSTITCSLFFNLHLTYFISLPSPYLHSLFFQSYSFFSCPLHLSPLYFIHFSMSHRLVHAHTFPFFASLLHIYNTVYETRSVNSTHRAIRTSLSNPSPCLAPTQRPVISLSANYLRLRRRQLKI